MREPLKNQWRREVYLHHKYFVAGRARWPPTTTIFGPDYPRRIRTLQRHRVLSLLGSKKVLAKRVDLARFLLINEGDFPNRKNDMADSSGTLDACADYTRRGVAAAPDHDADHAAREGRVVAEQKRLIRWAEENGRLKTRHRSLPEFARGGEHLVFYRQSNQRY